MTGPIRPEEVAEAKVGGIPEAVFQAFNELIAKHFVNGMARVKKDDVVDLIVEKGLCRADIFSNGWLNVEAAYRAAGWVVDYDKPGFNETYQATFSFRRR